MKWHLSWCMWDQEEDVGIMKLAGARYTVCQAGYGEGAGGVSSLGLRYLDKGLG